MNYVRQLYRATVICFQVGLLLSLSILGKWLVQQLHIPIPGSLLGMAILFLLLCFKVVRLPWVETGADYLLRVLVFLFVPPTVGIIDYGELLKMHGLALLLTIVASTLCVLSTTAIVANKWLNPQKKANSS